MGSGIAVAVLIAGYFYAYQKVLKYPKPVRKVRKYSKTLKINKNPKVNITPRKISITKIYQDNVKKSNKLLKGTPINEKTIPDKILDKKEGNLPK